MQKKYIERLVHGIFLLLGLGTVGCVLLVTVYLVIAGIPAIQEIGLIPFLFGKTWAPTAAEPSYGILPFILTSIYGTAGAVVLGVPVGFLTAVCLAKTAPNLHSRVIFTTENHPAVFTDLAVTNCNKYVTNFTYFLKMTL